MDYSKYRVRGAIVAVIEDIVANAEQIAGSRDEISTHHICLAYKDVFFTEWTPEQKASFQKRQAVHAEKMVGKNAITYVNRHIEAMNLGTRDSKISRQFWKEQLMENVKTEVDVERNIIGSLVLSML